MNMLNTLVSDESDLLKHYFVSACVTAAVELF